jgi:uncharacterized protein DUF2325
LSSHVPMPLYRPWIVESVPPGSLFAPPSGLAAPVPGETPARQRRKLWELASHLYCSIVGTCLSTTELRKVVAKFKGHELKGFSDLAVHEEAVKAAAHHDTASRLLHKALDRRHAATIKRFYKAQDTEAVRLLWEEALRSGDIPGAYWALLTHWASTPELIKSAFADVHMLSHLVGAANRADIRRLTALEAERAELALKVEKQQTQLRDAIVARDATIRRLNGVLAQKIAQERSAAANPPPQTQADEIMALRELVAALQQHLAAEVTRRERTEQRQAMLRATLSEVQAALHDAQEQTQQLRDELAAAEAQLAPPQSAEPDGQRSLPATLKGTRLLYVGGRPGHIPRIRAFVEEGQAEFLYHDGGVEERKGLLAGVVSRADAIFFPVDCISHDTVAVVKRLCRQTGKPYLPLRSTSLTSFIAALRRFEGPELEESLLTWRTREQTQEVWPLK